MLNKMDLESNVSAVVELGSGVVRCQDVLPKMKYFYYLKLAEVGSTAPDYVLVSENRMDDDFAVEVLANAAALNVGVSSRLKRHPLRPNKYGFTSMLFADSSYHAYFKGRLDEKRSNLVQVVPIYDCEFTGDESPDEFAMMRRDLVPTLNWEREVAPKILLRFDNPKTRGGTGDSEVLVKYGTLIREIDNLQGVSNGFIEIINHLGSVREVLSADEDSFVLIHERDDSNRENLSRDALLNVVHRFLTK